ncbi:MAG TPA: 50S ribosomal protein L27 [Candidatus Omnitrophota bacterium]|jgi:ribosomal protein L27|nr:50S ribosomal protein L27 [Candidatus Omnitrophota bacterium]HRZ14544.1 50S ribosomal protein L27 [Candidatus Omnitrophota bacterium]
MAGGKSTPKKDKKLKVSGGSMVKAGQILIRGLDTVKAGQNVRGRGTLFALCNGRIAFTKKKIGRTAAKMYINVIPA